MRSLESSTRGALVLLVMGTAGPGGGCRPAEPRTEADRLARGREVIERMSVKLGSARALRVTTHEVREEAKSSGGTRPVTLTRETVVRRPDRLYFKVSGDRENEVWYDGVGVTLALHKEKVFAQSRAPETLDKTLDVIAERYGFSAPFADYVYSSPAKALLAETTTGGWVGRETVDGHPTDHLAFKDKGVEWDLWVSAEGDPVPRKATAVFSGEPRLRKLAMTFTDWDLAPQVADDRFAPSVPEDYEGIAMLQRARILRNLPSEGEGGEPAQGEPKK